VSPACLCDSAAEAEPAPGSPRSCVRPTNHAGRVRLPRPLDRTQEVAGSSPASSISRVPFVLGVSHVELPGVAEPAQIPGSKPHVTEGGDVYVERIASRPPIAPPALPVFPTAVHASADVHDTADRSTPGRPGIVGGL
jgi:hypothetical protein